MKINFIYRISDAGNPKLKLDVATKMNCLDNFIKEFKSNIYVFADNCSEQTLNEIRQRGIEPIITSLGNSKSWQHVAHFAIQNFSKDSYVYMIEDDYLHLPGALEALQEGLQVADYVTLYDHPDKYINRSEQYGNPYVVKGGEPTRVILTSSTHWKHTNSTTMSFATSIETLSKDMEVWKYYTAKKVPNDFAAFQTLLKPKPVLRGRDYKAYARLAIVMLWRQKVKGKRTLISPIPSYATHAESAWLAPITAGSSIKSWSDVKI